MPQAIDASQLGLSADELAIIQQGQAAVAAGSSSSRAASRASSSGRVLLDVSSLSALGRHFDGLMMRIQEQLDYLVQQSQMVTMHLYDQTGAVIDNADAEIARFSAINQQIDELEMDFDRIGNIREIVAGFRARAEMMDRELDRSQPSGSSSRHGHGHHRSSKHRHGHSSSSRRERHH